MKEAISSAICGNIIALAHRALVHVISCTCVVLGVATITGCQNDPFSSTTGSKGGVTGLENSAQLQDILNQMQGTISEASKGAIEALGPHAKTLGNLSTEEVSKLFSWKYKLVQVEANEPPEVMEQALIELGADNWDCFSIIQVADKIRISCKKRPPSALGYLKHLQGLAQ